MAIAHVQSRGVQGDNVASQALAYLSNVTLDDWLLALCCARPGTGASAVNAIALSDSLGHTWTPMIDAAVLDGVLVAAWARANASAACTVTANPTAVAADASDLALLLFQYSGLYPGAGGPGVDVAFIGNNTQSEPRRVGPLLSYGVPGDRLFLSALFTITPMTINTGAGWTQRLEDETSPMAYHAQERIEPVSTLVHGEWDTPGDSALSTLLILQLSSQEPRQMPPFGIRHPRQEPLTRR